MNYRALPQDLLDLIFPYLTLNECVNAEVVSKVRDASGKESFFKKKIDEAKLAHPLLQAVISGDLDSSEQDNARISLLHLLRTCPEALFMKGDVSFPLGCDVFMLDGHPENLSKYKGRYIWLDRKKLIYIDYHGSIEEVVLDDISVFDNFLRGLSVQIIDDQQLVVLEQSQVKQMITENSSNRHRPIPHQRFYHVSAFQLMHFYCDDDMISHVMNNISFSQDRLHMLMREQLEELGLGGADIIKVSQHPLDLGFDSILSYKASYIVDYNDEDEPIFQETEHPLLENLDGLIYYKDVQNQVHWYRADRRARTIEPVEYLPIQISPDMDEQQQIVLKQAQQDFDRMVESIDLMENMSAKRSSRREHQLIALTMRYFDIATQSFRPVKLHQQGLNFELEGISFKNSRYDFNRLDNVYRKYYRMTDDKIWVEEIGHRQKECLWLLLRLCQKQNSFYPLPAEVDSIFFSRSYFVSNVAMLEENGFIYNLFKKHFTPGLGFNLAVFKGPMPCGMCDSTCGDNPRFVSRDLIGCLFFAQVAKINIEKRYQTYLSSRNSLSI